MDSTQYRFLRKKAMMMYLLLFLFPFATFADEEKVAETGDKTDSETNSVMVPPSEEDEEIKNSILTTITDTTVTAEANESQADALARDAAEAYMNGDYDIAVEKYLEAIKILGSLNETPRISEKIERCKVRISKAYYYWAYRLAYEAEKLMKEEHFDEAIKSAQDAMEIYPPCKDQMEIAIKKYQQKKDALQYRQSVIDATYDPEREERLYNIDLLLAQGETYYQNKQWDKARDKFLEALTINPYNERAINNLRKTGRKLIEAGETRERANMAEVLAEALWDKVPAILNQQVVLDNTIVMPKDDLNTSQIVGKLKDIYVDNISFEDVAISTVMKYLKQKSREKDPENVGVNFVLLLVEPGMEANNSATNEYAPAPAAAGGAPAPRTPGSGPPGMNTIIARGDAIGREGEYNPAPAAVGTGDIGGAVYDEFAYQEPTITMSITSNTSLEEIIYFICQAAGMKSRIERHAVIIAAPDVPLDDVETKIYPVEREALDLIGTQTDQESVRQFFLDRGILFDAGAQIVYDAGIGRLIVTNTPEQLAKVDRIIREMNVVDPQVLIITKFLEIGMNDLEELGFQYVISRPTNYQGDPVGYALEPMFETVNILNTDGTWTTKDVIAPQVADYDFDMVRVYSVLNNNKYETAREVDQGSPYLKGDMFIVPLSTTDGNAITEISQYYAIPLGSTNGKSVVWQANDTMVRTMGDSYETFGLPTSVNDVVSTWSHSNSKGYNFSASIAAVDQADSTEILSAPRLITMNGMEATIRMVTEVYYPEGDWNEAEITELTANNQTIPVFTPSTPEFGDPTEEGIVLTVTPNVDADKYTISLVMNPRVQSFGGWQDYSYYLPLGDNGKLYPNKQMMPKIVSREVRTNASCYDGETVFLGGVIRDRTSEVDDSIPILGDLPLIGRLFSSKGKSSQKTNLIISLTCRLVNPDGSPLREHENRSIPAF